MAGDIELLLVPRPDARSRRLLPSRPVTWSAILRFGSQSHSPGTLRSAWDIELLPVPSPDARSRCLPSVLTFHGAEIILSPSFDMTLRIAGDIELLLVHRLEARSPWFLSVEMIRVLSYCSTHGLVLGPRRSS